MRPFVLLLLLGILVTDARAQSLNHRATPIFGTITLRAGFTPDPNVALVNAGGNDRNPISGTGCRGFLTASAPDLKLNYTAGSLPLTLSAHADRDLSMVVRTPDGRFLCDDDSGEGLDPLITLESPRSGEYAVWIATYSQTDQRPQARVAFSELRRDARYNMGTTPVTPSVPSSPNTPYAPDVSGFNWMSAPLFGTVNLRAGFAPDPQFATVTAGGSTRNPLTGTGCRGFFNLSSPDLKLNYTAGSLPLTVSANADRDLTMVMRTPSGEFLCDDDSGEGSDPLLTVRSPLSGEYAIWIGTYTDTSPRPQARVTFSELGRNARYQTNTMAPITQGQGQMNLPAGSTSLNAQAPALFGNVTLRAGFTPDPTVSNVNAGGMDRNPLTGPGCVGFLTAAAPDLKLNYTAGSLPLTFSANAERDLSMVVRTPDGQFLCDDDSGEGLDPLITIQSPRTGEYAIWVATYSQSDQRVASRVTFSELGRNAQYNMSSGGGSGNTTTPRLNERTNGTSGNPMLRAGFTPDPTSYTLTTSGRFQNPVEGTGCVGWFNSADPDLKVNYTAGSLPLTFSATSARDLAMVVLTPDGTWFCDDDSGENADPLITVNNPRSGDYRIWVGPYSQTQDRISTSISVSELGRNARYSASGK